VRFDKLASKMTAMRLIWMPGIKPVIVPAVIPSNNAKVISKIKLFL